MLPWGAVSFDPEAIPSDGELEHQLATGLQRELRRDRDGTPVYRVLVISGGGSRGAYGAGVLTGWTETGTRPDFDVVTGVSTGALMATFAFLGSEYDDRLRLFTQIDNDDIYVRRGALAVLGDDALRDTTPLRNLIAQSIDEEVLGEVARAHRAGRRSGE